MDRIDNLTLADFNRKLRKYCTSAVACAAKEKECIERLETIISQRDFCLTHLAQEKEKERLLCEEIEDLHHQREDALEFLQMVEKRCQKYAPSAATPTDNESASPKTEHTVIVSKKDEGNVDDETCNEHVFRKILRKYCNLYVQFDKRSNIIRTLSLEDNSYFEFSLNERDCNELRQQIWSKIGSSSVHLSSWEKLLYHLK